jgi:hypothetical protein
MTRSAVGVRRSRAYKARAKNKVRIITMKNLGIVLASLIAISFVTPTIAEARDMRRDKHFDKRHHDDHHKKPSLLRKLLH